MLIAEVFNKKLNHYELVSKKPKHWLGIKEVSKHARYAIMISEDWAFYEHEGFDLNQIKIVIRDSLKERKLVRGASTITQQVVKNALLSNERSLTRKLKEFLLAREIENVLTKDEDANGDGDPRNDFSDPKNPNLPDYLNPNIFG